MTKEQLIKLIHVAKSKLQLDDETYRILLVEVTGKKSAKLMLKHELEKVYDALKKKGFKRKVKTEHSPSVGIAKRRAYIQKIRAIWITMGEQQFIDNSSDKALDAYVERMTRSKMRLNGIPATAWLDVDLGCHVLESLKKWHLRCIFKIFESIPVAIIKKNSLTISGATYRGYDDISDFYQSVLNAKKQLRGEK